VHNLRPLGLPKTWQDADKAFAMLRTFLNAMAVHRTAADAERNDIIIVGTHKDSVGGGDAMIRQLSDRVFAELKGCPAFRRVRMHGDLYLHAVENSRSDRASKDFDPSIQQLALAIDEATDELPSMMEKVPTRWLKVLDQMQARGASEQYLSLDEAQAISAECGLPHTGLTLLRETRALLQESCSAQNPRSHVEALLLTSS
jgi:hypothetical protein